MKNTKIEQFLGSLTKEVFLDTYWNKKPLLIKAAWTKAKSLASKEDLLDFASDDDFESRIIYENSKDNYTVKDGPIKENDLEGSYTVACHALNLFNDDFKELEEIVTDIIPHWQFDDVMATLSMKGASVGAHTDHYGVFILQGEGKREWFIQENPKQDFKEDLAVKILKEFKPDYSHVLEPGDMIYIPPLCAHHGVTLEESISYSIGFKAFEVENIVKDYLYDFGQNFESSKFYKNDKDKPKHELDDEFVDYFHREVLEGLKDKNLFKSWLASSLSSARYPEHNEAEELDLQEYELAMDFKYVYYLEEDRYQVYINEQHISLDEGSFKQLNQAIVSGQVTENIDKNVLNFLTKSGAFI